MSEQDLKHEPTSLWNRSLLKIRRSHDRLIFNMGIPIPGKGGLYIETGPWEPLLVSCHEVNSLQHMCEQL